MSDGQITRKDIITDDALAWGTEYAKTLDLAIGKNREFVDSIIMLNAENVKLRRSENQTDYIKQKNELKLITDQTLLSLKEEQALELSLEKIKQEKLKTDKLTLANQAQLERSQKNQNAGTTESNRITKLQVVANMALEGSYKKIQAQLSLNTLRWKELSAAERANTAEGKALTKEILNQENALKKLDAQIGKNQRNVGNYGSAFKSITSSASSLFGAFGIVGGVSAFAAVTTDIFEQTKKLQGLDLALQTVTGTQKNFAEQQQFLRKISTDYGADINTLTESFVGFYASAKDKISGNEIQDIFASITKAGGVLGLSVERQEKAFLALNQMMSKGTIQAEELRGQLSEALPNSMGIMTKAVQALHPELQVTEKMLGEMMKDGQLMSADVLPEFARQMEIAYGIENVRRVETLTAKTNRMSNEWTDFIRVLNESPTGGFFGSFFGTMMDMGSDFLKLLKNIVSTQSQIDKGIVLNAQQRGKDSFNQEANSKYSQTTSAEDKLYLAVQKSKGAASEIQRLNKELKLAEAQAEKTIVKFGSGYEALLKRVTDIKEQIGFQSGVNTAAKARYTQLTTPKKTNTDVKTETEAQRIAREKREAKAREDLEKQLSDALYDLQKQRLEQTIKINQEIVADETKTDEQRIQALYISQTKQEDLVKLTKNHLLDNDKLVANERIRINEDAANKKVEIEKKTALELDKINQFDEVKYQKELELKVSKNTVAMNAELQTENERFAKLGDLEAMAQSDREKAVEDHERKIFEIKKSYALKALDLQISNLETELAANDALPASDQVSADKRQKIAETLSKAKLERSEIVVSTNSKGNEKEVENEKEKAMRILDISSQLTGALTDLANGVFEAKIQNIENEIDKNNEYYDKQIELAGNDERQKDLLQKERDKKNEELEKKKRVAQHKQAVFNKASALAQAGISTALAILNALNTTPFLPLGPTMATLAGVLGAIQIGAILATPIPKYKDGRKGGPAEMAWVGDGGVPEVVTRPDGSNPRLTPNVPTLMHLGQGDVVHKSVDDYVKTSILNGFSIDTKLIADFQANSNNMYGKELLDELKRNTQAIKGQKFPTSNNQNLDINHHLWKMKNTNWN